MYVFDHDCNELGKYNFKWTDNSKGKWLCTNASNPPEDCTVTWSQVQPPVHILAWLDLEQAARER